MDPAEGNKASNWRGAGASDEEISGFTPVQRLCLLVLSRMIVVLAGRNYRILLTSLDKNGRKAKEEDVFAKMYHTRITGEAGGSHDLSRKLL